MSLIMTNFLALLLLLPLPVALIYISLETRGLLWNKWGRVLTLAVLVELVVVFLLMALALM